MSDENREFDLVHDASGFGCTFRAVNDNCTPACPQTMILDSPVIPALLAALNHSSDGVREAAVWTFINLSLK